MGNRITTAAVAGGTAAVALAVMLLPGQSAAQAPAAAYRAPRSTDGKPNLSGIWQALNEANWDIQAHPAQAGPPEYGALFAEPAGVGIVEGNDIPYRPEMLARKKFN